MLSAAINDIFSRNKVQDDDDDKNRDLIKILNESEVSVVSSRSNYPWPIVEMELRKIVKSLKNNGDKLLPKSNCLERGLLTYAARVGDIELLKQRIRQGADVNSSGQKGSSPLHVAAWYGHPEIIELLINNGARLDPELNGPMKNGYTPLHLACLNNKIKCVRVLLNYGASVTPKAAGVHHPIHIAVFKNNVVVAALLLNHGVDVNLRFDNTFFYNKWNKLIFWKDMDLTLLHCSIARKYKEMTALLLEHGADIHLKTRSNKTSLMHAVEANDPELVESFLEKGENPNDKDIYGEPVLFYTLVNAHNQSKYNNVEEFYSGNEKLSIIKLLYAAGADINAKFLSNGFYNSLVYYTCKYTQLDTARYILGKTNFDWRNIDVPTLMATKFTTRSISPIDDCNISYFSSLLRDSFSLEVLLSNYIFSKHMIGLPVKEELLSAVASLNYQEAFFLNGIEPLTEYFKKIIRYAKEKTIGNTKISLWHVLTCKMTELVRLSFHKDFRSLCLKDYADDLKDYCDMFEFRLKTAIKRSTSIEKSSKIMFDLFYNYIPYDCCEKIATCFDDKELDDFIKNSSNDIVY